jgi:ubiquinone/menaquinone biosynthesis C-methylase UbiE
MFSASSMPDAEWWKTLWPTPDRVVLDLLKLMLKQYTPSEPSDAESIVIIDLCCGDGHFTIPLAQVVPNAQIYGIEIDCDVLNRAKSDAIDSNITNCTWVCGDVMDLRSIVRDRADIILMANTFHGVPDKNTITRIIYDALKPGGVFCVINWRKMDRDRTTVMGIPRGPKTEMRMDISEVVDVLSNNFELKYSVDLPPYHYGAVFVKL